MTSDTLTAALEYAARGWRVVPILPQTKRPRLNEWQLRATTDADQLHQWWGSGEDGIGIATGPASGIFVLDVDVADGKRGDESLAELESLYGALPPTLEVHTGSGGRHLYFRWPEGSEIRNDASKRLGLGLDIRGEGGQVVAPPTRHPNGNHYTWDLGCDEPADAPGWLIQLLTEDPWATFSTDQHTDVVTAVDEQSPSRSIAVPNASTSTSPAEHYNQVTTWPELLTADGWTLDYVDRSGEQHWVRPGKDARDGTSATVGWKGLDMMRVFTTSLPWLPEGAYGRFGYYACRHHGGDRSAAARAIRKEMGWTPSTEMAHALGVATILHVDSPSGAMNGTATTATTPATANASTSNPQASSTGSDYQDQNKADAFRTTAWAPIDVAAVMADDYQPIQPEVLERPDGKAMFYPNRVNMLMGESGGGKSWVALLAVGIALTRGQAAVYVDLEDHPRSITDRLRALGVDAEAIAEHFVYIRPDIAAKHAEVAQVRHLLADLRPAMLVIDSVGEAMALHGLKQNDDDAVAQWFTFMPREWAKETCVILIDHVPKSSEANPLHAIGSQRKKAAIDGAMYRGEQVKAMGHGLTGRLSLITAKDRHGSHAIKSKACEIEFAANDDGTVVTATVAEPEERDADGHVKRPTVLMRKVYDYVEMSPGLSGRQIVATVSGATEAKRRALQVLVDEGFVRVEAVGGRGGGLTYYPVRPFRDDFEIGTAPSAPNRASTAPRRGSRPPENEPRLARLPSVLTEEAQARFGGLDAQENDEPRLMEKAAPSGPIDRPLTVDDLPDF